jgi:hypothetical protein
VSFPNPQRRSGEVGSRHHLAEDSRAWSGNAGVFAASDWARTMTPAIVNLSFGALVD